MVGIAPVGVPGSQSLGLEATVPDFDLDDRRPMGPVQDGFFSTHRGAVINSPELPKVMYANIVSLSSDSSDRSIRSGQSYWS